MEPGTSTTALDLESDERFLRVGKALGVTAFGLNQMVLLAGQRSRIHTHAHQEEVFVVLEGELTVHLGPDESVVAGRGEVVRVAPEVRRQVANVRREKCVLLAIGGAGEHLSRDATAYADWDDEVGGEPRDIPVPEDLEVG